jgi:hypothetical protein
MKDNIEKLVSMSRRKMVGCLTMLVALAAGNRSPLSGQQPVSPKQGKSLLTPDDLKPFEAIARRKGVKIHTTDFTAKIATDNIHLDMDMVDESIRSAIKQTQKTGQTLIRTKLERLLATGTDAQKVEFVLGSGTYYFPEDIEKLAKLSRASGGLALSVDCHKVCETVWYYICRCTGSAQECRDEARELCHIVCD